MLLPISTLSPFVNVIIVLFYGTLVWICANAFCIFICIQRADIFTQYTKKYLAIFLSVSVYAVFLYLCRWVWKYINIHNEHAVILFCVEWTYRSNYDILIIESPLIHMHATPWPLIQMSISISSDDYLVYVFRITYMSTIHFHHIHTNNPFLTLPKPLNPNFISFFFFCLKWCTEFELNATEMHLNTKLAPVHGQTTSRTPTKEPMLLSPATMTLTLYPQQQGGKALRPRFIHAKLFIGLILYRFCARWLSACKLMSTSLWCPEVIVGQ